MQNEFSQEVVARFFQAIDYLKGTGDLRFLTDFTEPHHINRRHFWVTRNTPSSGMFQLCWLTWLVEDYGVSAKWLLTGKGKML